MDYGLSDDLGNFLNQEVDERPDGRGQAVAERNDRRDVGLTCQPVGQDSLEPARPHVFTTNIAWEGHNPETVPCSLLQHHDVIAGKPGLDWHDQLATRRML